VCLCGSILVFVLAGCQTAAPPTNTPLNTLAPAPTEAGSPGTILVPTRLPDAVIEAADAEYALLTNLAERAAPSVVSVQVAYATPHAVLGEKSRASGFIYDGQGNIVTTAHLVAQAARITVVFDDGRAADASLVGYDTASDLAVIRVSAEPSQLRPLSFTETAPLQIGQRAVILGNPFGLGTSLLTGVISGLGRQIPAAEQMTNILSPGFQTPAVVQIDARLPLGYAGSPMLNTRGELTGVAVALRTGSGLVDDLGFAVPAESARRIIAELIAAGKVDYAWLGIGSRPIELGGGVAALVEALSLAVSQGVLVENVTPGSPAAEAGLRGGSERRVVRGAEICAGGDIIVAVNDVFIASIDELLAYLVANTRPGDTIRLLIVRQGESLEVEVTLRSRPAQIPGEESACGG
jgi:2-alkenal reductase